MCKSGLNITLYFYNQIHVIIGYILREVFVTLVPMF